MLDESQKCLGQFEEGDRVKNAKRELRKPE
jgi:hypothetical protein